jgi:hypothetical protein
MRIVLFITRTKRVTEPLLRTQIDYLIVQDLDKWSVGLLSSCARSADDRGVHALEHVRFNLNQFNIINRPTTEDTGNIEAPR